MAPVGIYGITKTTGTYCCRLYRGAGVRASVGILYNHESPLRKPDFVSQKIVRAAVDIRRGRTAKLVLGDLSALNDWGWAEDTVDAMIRIARLDAPDDFVVATGEAHSVAELVEAVFTRAGLDWKRHVEEDRSRIARLRPPLIGDSSRLRERTGWKPKVGFEEMAARLWDAAWAAEGAALGRPGRAMEHSGDAPDLVERVVQRHRRDANDIGRPEVADHTERFDRPERFRRPLEDPDGELAPALGRVFGVISSNRLRDSWSSSHCR